MAGKKKDRDLTQLSDDELMSEWTDLGKEAQEIKERLTAFSHEHQRREREAQLRSMLGGFSEADKAFLQGMEPDGVESQAEVGNI